MNFWADLSSFLPRWTTLWSFGTTAGTIAMAVMTYRVVRQGEKQHRDRFRPICSLMPYSGVDPLNKRGDLLEAVAPLPDNQAFGALKVKCRLQNVGPGPARKLRIKFRFPHRSWETEPWELAPLQAGEGRGGPDSPLVVPFQIPRSFGATNLQMLPGEVWEIRLEYEDVFGKRFCSTHHKMPWPLEELKKRDAMSGPPQPWVTFPDCRPAPNLWLRRATCRLFRRGTRHD
jgi:hypothetical protein